MSEFAQPYRVHMLTHTDLQIKFHAYYLDGKSDPYLKVFYRFGSGTSFQLVGQTKAIENTENPDWNEVLRFELVPGSSQVSPISPELPYGPGYISMYLYLRVSTMVSFFLSSESSSKCGIEITL